MFIQIMPTTEAYYVFGIFKASLPLSSMFDEISRWRKLSVFLWWISIIPWWWHSNEFQGDFIYRCVNKLTQCVVINWFAERNESRSLSPVLDHYTTGFCPLSCSSKCQPFRFSALIKPFDGWIYQSGFSCKPILFILFCVSRMNARCSLALFSLSFTFHLR